MSVYQTNMLGPLLTTQAFLPLLRKGGKKQVLCLPCETLVQIACSQLTTACGLTMHAWRRL